MPAKLEQYLGLPDKAIAHGATTPNPGVSYCQAWSTIENDVIAWNGTSWRIAGKGAATKLYGLRFADNTQKYATQSSGGELGVSTGFGSITLMYVRRLPTTLGILRSKSASGGWSHQCLPAPIVLYAGYHNGSTVLDAPYVTITPAMVGRIVLFISRITAVPGVIEASADLLWASATPAIAGYLGAPTIAANIGTYGGTGYPPVDIDVLAGVDFRGVPSRAQLDAYVLAARAAGDLPSTMNGATITHRTSLKEALAGTSVTAGQVAPASLPDTITLAAADAYTRAGSPTVTEIDQAALDGVRVQGLRDFASGTYYASASGAGILTNAAGFHVIAEIKLDVQTHPTSQMFATGQNWCIQQQSNQLRWCDRTASVAAVYNILAADVGVRLLVVAQYTGTAWEFQIRPGAAAGSMTGSAGPGTAQPLYISSYTPGAQLIDRGAIYKLAGGPSKLTAAEIEQLYADNLSGVYRGVVGKTTVRYDIGADIAAASDTAPATITDRIGTAHLTRTGGSSVSVTYDKRRVWNLEATPISYGFNNTTTAPGYYQTTGGPGTHATLLWIAFYFYLAPVLSGQLSGLRIPFQRGGPNTNGWDLRISAGAGSAVAIQALCRASPDAYSPGSNGTTDDNGRRHLYVFSLESGVVRSWWKRAEVGAGTTVSGYKPATGVATIGTWNGSYPGEGITMLGFLAGHAAVTRAEIQALFDRVQADEELPATGIPGKTGYCLDIHRQFKAAGGVAPTSLTDEISGDVWTKTNSPIVEPIYTRTFGW